MITHRQRAAASRQLRHRGRTGIHRWRALLLAALWTGLPACAQEAAFVRETPTGGTVAFTFTKESDTLSSPGRHDAIALIDRKCPRGYALVREGIVPRVSTQVDRHWRGQINATYDGGEEERLWGLQFTCK